MLIFNFSSRCKLSHNCWIIILWTFATTYLFGNCNAKTFNRRQDTSSISTTPITATFNTGSSSRDIMIGSCTWVIGRTCPDKDVKFYLYTQKNKMDRQLLYIDKTLDESNLTTSFFNPKHPTKIIIHGYNADMFLHPLHMMREEYLARGEYNLIYVDWAILSPGPCYISAVHNTKHTGACVAQLVERILDYGSADIHVIGFSLGAQVPNYIARNLGSFLLPRITGLDPALPLFITASANDKLDASDAVFVDVIHTNALVQGKLERCGHADFYMNGGIMQPGCNSHGSNPFACSHQRAPVYFLESIRSAKGFWGWSCSNYIAYLLGMCPPTNYLVKAGENIRMETKGMFLISTNDTSPYALGKWTDLPTLGVKHEKQGPSITLTPPKQNGDPLLRHVDQWGKLETQFNNLALVPTPYSQDPYGENWSYFGAAGTGEITNELKDNNSVEEQVLEKTEKNTSDISDKWWHEYHRNLTTGFIDNSIFSVPQVKGEYNVSQHA